MNVYCEYLVRKDIKARFALRNTNGFREFSPTRSYRLSRHDGEHQRSDSTKLCSSIQLVARVLSPWKSVTIFRSRCRREGFIAEAYECNSRRTVENEKAANATVQEILREPARKLDCWNSCRRSYLCRGWWSSTMKKKPSRRGLCERG